MPSASADTGPTFKDLVTHPIDTFSRLADYAGRTADYSKWHSLSGTAVRMAGDVGYKSDAERMGLNPTTALALRQQAERDAAPEPAHGFLQGTAGLLGGLTGSLVDTPLFLASPEFKGLKFGRYALPAVESAAHPVAASIANHAIGNAALMGVVDPITQGGNIIRNQQDGYDPFSTLGSMAFGATFGGGLHAAGAVGQAIREVGSALEGAIPKWEEPYLPKARPTAPQAQPNAPVAGPITIDDLWSRLVHRESGGNQGAVSPKGAFGTAQLMPDTARQVAEGIGRPELADTAAQNTAEGAAVNQYLGRIYLGQQLARFDDPALALAAYNAGPARVAEWIRRFGSPDVIGRGKFIDMIPFKETRDYVRNIMGNNLPEEGALHPDEYAASTDALHSHYQDGGYLPPSEAPVVAPYTPYTPDMGPEMAPENAAATQAQNAADVQADLEKRAAGWDSGNPAEKSDLPPKSDFPGDWAPKPSPPAAPVQIGPGDLWRTPHEDLLRLRDQVGMSDDEKLVQALGPEGAADFKRLDRASNSQDPRRADAAIAEMHAKFGNLTPEQERLIYGIGETGPQKEEINTVLEAHSDVMNGDDRGWLSYMAAVAARHTSPEEFAAVLRGEGSARAQADFVRMQKAYEGLQAHGVAADQIPNEMAQALVDRAGWSPKDANEIIGGFVHEMAAMRGEAPPPVHPALPAPDTELDITDQALNQMRSGKPVKMGEGKSLAEALVEKGGIRNQGGELGRVADGGDKFWKLLVRKNTGMSLEDAAEFAEREGYIGRGKFVSPESRDAYTSYDVEGLIKALEKERGGEKVYAEDRINHQARALADHIYDLEPFLHELGVDPSTHTNAEIRAAMDRHFRSAGEHSSFLSEADRLNAEGARAAEMERAIRDREAGRDHGPMEEGGLWDETRRGEQSMFDDHYPDMDEAGDLLMQGRGKRTELSQAARRVAQRHEIDAATRGLSPGERRRDAVPATERAPNSPALASLTDIWRSLKEAFDATVRKGVNSPKARGTYNLKTGAIRQVGINDLSNLVHELAHDLEFGKKPSSLLATMAQHSETLKHFDYDQKALRRHEGFAEWMRWYVTNPEMAKQRAPLFYDAFEKALAADEPKLLEALQSAQTKYGEFMAAPSIEAAAHSIAHRGQPGLIHSFLNIASSKGTSNAGLGAAVHMAWQEAMHEVYRGVVDQLHPWRRAEEGLIATARRNGVYLEPRAANSPTALLRQTPAVYGIGHADLIYGVHGYHELNPGSASFAAALEHAFGTKGWDLSRGGIRDQFDAYLEARRVRHDFTPGLTGAEPPPGTTKAYWDQIVDQAEARHPQFVRAAEMVYDYTQALFKKMHDAGLITDEQHLEATQHNPDYVPLHKDISDHSDTPGGAKGRSTKSAGGLQRRTGRSFSPTMSPTDSIMLHTYNLNARIAFNDALRTLDALASMAGPGSAAIMERVKAKEMHAVQTSVNEVFTAAAKKEGLSKTDQLLVKQALEDAFGVDDAKATIYRAKDAGEDGHPILYMWDKGERIPLRMPDGMWGQHMVEAFAGMTPPMRSTLFNILRAPSYLARAGTVLHPSFGLITNPLRDQMTAPFTSGGVGYLPGIDWVKGMMHELKGDDVARQYAVVGGHMGGAQTAAERTARLKADINVLRTKDIVARYFASPEAVMRAMELTETGTRLGVFDKGLQHYGAEGMTPWEAAREAGANARDMMDFDRHGAWPGMRAMARLVPFMNASIQGVDKMLRVGAKLANAEKIFGAGAQATAKEHHEYADAVKLLIGFGAIAVGSLGIRAAMKGNPKFDEAANYMRDTAWVFPLGEGNLVGLVPKPFEIASGGNVMERAYEAMHLKDTHAWWNMAQGLASNLLPNVVPTVVQLGGGLASGRTQQGAPIVPANKEKMDPQFQVGPHTSLIAQAIGNATAGLHTAGNDIDWRQSPAKLDFIFKTLFSSAGREALNATDAVGHAVGIKGVPKIDMSPADWPILSRVIKDVTRGSESSHEFWSLMSSQNGDWMTGFNSAKGLVDSGDTAGAMKYINEMPPAKRDFVLLQLGGNARDKAGHPLARAAVLSATMSGMAQRLQQGDPKIFNTQTGTLDPVPLDPHQRRMAVDALNMMALAEQRNALIAVGDPGWSNKQPLPFDKPAYELAKASPQLPKILDQILQTTARDLIVSTPDANGDAHPHIMTAAESYKGWSRGANLIHQLKDGQIANYLTQHAEQGRPGLVRALEKPVPVK